MRLLYTLIYYLAIPFVLLRQLWRARHDRRHIERLGERFGFISPITGQRKRVWIHTVSVGEFLGALPLLQQLLLRPDIELIVTSTTITGSERVQQTLGSRVHHFYMPYDLPGALRRFIRIAEPDVLVIMETELWPNTIAACNATGVRTLLINARLSERSARGYARLPRLTAAMLSRLTAAAIQSEADAERFIKLGLAREKITCTGNIKFDISVDDAQRASAAALKTQWSVEGPRLVWLVASTHQGEDDIILQALTVLRERGFDAEQLLLVLVPRHPERFDSVAGQVGQAGFSLVRRSARIEPGPHVDVVVGDTMGELNVMYGASDMVFMGGTLVDVGGHNFIEPAIWAKPLVSGPVLYNFAEVSRLMQEAGALELADTAEAIADAVQALVQDSALRKVRGEAACQVANNNRGALDTTLKLVGRWLQ